MGRVSRREFLDRTPTFRGKYFNLREVARTVGFINCHDPNGGYWTRKRHPSFAAKDGGDKKWHGFNCVNQEDGDKAPCPVCLLKDFAGMQIDAGFKPEMILIGDGSRGRDAVDFTLNELATQKTDQRRGVPSAVKEEMVLPWISIEPDMTGDESPIKPFIGTTAVWKDYQKMLVEQEEEHGEEGGDPVTNPYPIVMKYDKDAKSPQDFYDVQRSSRDVEIDEDLQGLLDDDPMDYDIDLAKLTEPGNPVDMLEAIEAAWVCDEVDFKEFREFYEKRAGKKGGGRKGGKGKQKAKAKKEPEPESEEETFECDCGKVLPWSTDVCPGCGAEFEPDEGDDDPGDAGSDNRKGVWCEQCQQNMVPNKKGRCPECFTELDVM